MECLEGGVLLENKIILIPGDQLMVINNGDSGAQSHKEGSHGNQLMVVEYDESRVQDNEDDNDDFDKLELLL
jgi:ssDNA-binding replication factor A large subunit